jgi:Cu(I)/Ag(I) efflux system membrane fusion protein
VDRLYEKETGVKVSKGQAIYKIYSEELLTLQKDYILNTKQQKAFPTESIYKALLNASLDKLKLYGYSDNQIHQLLNTVQNNPYIIVYAPIGGVISEINISEGQYIGEGSPVFKIENFDQLWVEAEIYPSEISDVKIGQMVSIQISGYEKENIKSKIEFISPQLDSQNQIITIRSSINNSENKFQPGMQANLSLSYINKKNVVSLPNDAVIRDQTGDHVWVKTAENNFEYRIVEIGAENESSVIIKTGLKIGDEVVISGAYLLTSEFILKKGGDFMEGMNR